MLADSGWVDTAKPLKNSTGTHAASARQRYTELDEDAYGCTTSPQTAGENGKGR